MYLEGVDFEMKRGGLYTVIGRTMAGKTSLLRVIAGLEERHSGQLTLDGEDLTQKKIWERDIAMVYQEFINYPHLTVVENVVFPLLKKGFSREEAKTRALEFLAKVELDGFGDRRPSELSGGQQQRVALARALAKGSGILLLDEPLVNLDYKLREQMREEFEALFEEQEDSIVVYTTTEPAEALMLGDEVLVMHLGRLVQSGTPAEVFERPASTAVARIISDPPMSIFAGQIENGSIRLGGDVVLTVPDHIRGLGSGRYLFGLRPDAIELRSDADGSGVVGFSEVSGSETFVHVETDFGELVVLLEGIHSYHVDTRVGVSFAAEDLFVFGEDIELLRAPGDA
jgi:glycerol transport system ATP-binding protein